MHFLFQALHKRPLEPKSLAVSRGVSAVLLSLAFLAYVGFLIYQIYADERLLLISTKQLQSYPAPDVEMCVYGSNLNITACSLIDMKFNKEVVPGCLPYLVGSPAENEGPQWCKLFKTDDILFGVDATSATPASSSPSSPSSTKTIRRVDIYWAITNLTAFNQVNPWAPSVTVTLYSPGFSPWRLFPDDMKKMIPQEQTAWRNLQLQRHVSTTITNHWSNIYFSPARYRAIRPYEALSILGLKTTFTDIDTLQTSQHDWPLNNASVDYTTYGNYQGEFSFMLTAGNMEVRTEQRQHNVLGALALAGGCYGVIFAAYCVLFGTPKLTPFGFTHGISLWYYKLDKKRAHRDDETAPAASGNINTNNSHSNDTYNAVTATGFHLNSEQSFIPMTRINSDNSSDDSDHDGVKASLKEHPTSTVVDIGADTKEAPAVDSDDISSPKSTRYSLQYFAHLESRVHELESILREYFLDVDYLDALRMRRRQEGASTTTTTNNTTLAVRRPTFSSLDDDDPPQSQFLLFGRSKAITGFNKWA